MNTPTKSVNTIKLLIRSGPSGVRFLLIWFNTSEKQAKIRKLYLGAFSSVGRATDF